MCLGARLLPQPYQYSNLLEGADRVSGQLRGDKECPFSGITKSGRVWRKVPESNAQSVSVTLVFVAMQPQHCFALHCQHWNVCLSVKSVVVVTG